uniref:probable cytochrome P450 4p2 n=1 Tax=Vespula vulgaris TaxID=7454 RepID=UPI00223AB407|nr:probable cytochrome P450 4p2 [Vespula vulgaris]
MHDDIKDMKFLERVIKEILLFYSVIAIIARKVTQDVEVIKNSTIPKRSSADLFNYNLHCNEKYWILLLVLDPDRFLPERCSFSNFFSFSYGRRNYIDDNNNCYIDMDIYN